MKNSKIAVAGAGLMGLAAMKNFFGFSSEKSLPVRQQPAQAVKNLGNTVAPVQLERLRHDVLMWRQAITEAESAWYPQRVRMQRMYLDTPLNGHVFSVMDRRKDLTLLRDFRFVDQKKVESEVLTDQFRLSEWFQDFVSYSMDALFYGYSLIALGDVVNDEFPYLQCVKRWNVSPDRLQVSPFAYGTTGTSFVDAPFCDWHVYAKTASENGQSLCGYGLFYKVALYEIVLRNLLGYNTDFVELYSQPYRVGKTMKTDENERAELELALQQMGSSGYAIIDETDSIEFLETALGGNGWQGYENLEMRCEKKISKIILGHADAMDSTAGKLGSQQGKDENPQTMALTDKQTKDGRYIESIVNRQLLPKMRKLGFKLPEGIRFEYKNDKEVEEFRNREDQSNLITSQIAQTLKTAGMTVDPAYIQERTGIPVTAAPEVQPVEPVAGSGSRIKAKLQQIYR